MSFLFAILISGLIAASAFVLAQGLFDLRQRQVARFRALGVRLNQGSLREFLKELRRSRSEKRQPHRAQGCC